MGLPVGLGVSDLDSEARDREYDSHSEQFLLYACIYKHTSVNFEIDKCVWLIISHSR